MQIVATVAVEATREQFRTLTHQPSGIGFEEDGTARWPADQFTFRLRDEGSIRLLEDLHDTGAPAEPKEAKRQPAADAPAALPADPVPAPTLVEVPAAPGRTPRPISPLKPQE